MDKPKLTLCVLAMSFIQNQGKQMFHSYKKVSASG